MITLDLAGWRVRLACRPAALDEAVAARYAPFATAAPPHLTAQVTGRRSQVAGRKSQVTGRRSQALLDVTLRRDGDAYLFDTGVFCGTINLGHGTAALSLRSATPLADLEYFVRILYALLAEREGGLLIHAAGLLAPPSSGGQAHLFVGQSGSGKDTLDQSL